MTTNTKINILMLLGFVIWGCLCFTLGSVVEANPPNKQETPTLTSVPIPIMTQIIVVPTLKPNLHKNKINPGTYIIGIDIPAGLYKGKAGKDIMDGCYWKRVRDLSGNTSIETIIASNIEIGQFYVQVSDTDFALTIKCELEYVGEIK